MTTFVILISNNPDGSDLYYLGMAKGLYIKTANIEEAISYSSHYAAKQAAKNLPHKVIRGGVVWIQKTASQN